MNFVNPFTLRVNENHDSTEVNLLASGWNCGVRSFTHLNWREGLSHLAAHCTCLKPWAYWFCKWNWDKRIHLRCKHLPWGVVCKGSTLHSQMVIKLIAITTRVRLKVKRKNSFTEKKAHLKLLTTLKLLSWNGSIPPTLIRQWSSHRFFVNLTTLYS